MPSRMFFRSLATLAAALLLAGSPQARAETLTDALIAAYKNSNLLDQNRALLRAADEDVAVAVSSLRPVIDYTVSSTYRNQIGLFAGEDLNAIATLSAQMTLFDNGRNKFGIEVAKESVLAAREALIGIEQQVLLAAVTAYMNVRSQLEFVLLRQRNVRVIEQELRAARDRFDVGEVTRTDVSLAEARLAAARSSLAAAEGDLAVAREAYKAATGAYPGTLAAPPGAPVTAETLDGAKAIADRTHPAIRQVQHQVTASELNLARSEASLGPSVRAEIAKTLDDDQAHSMAYSLSYSQPVYHGGQLRALSRQARANAEASRAGLLQTALNVEEAVGRAWAQLAVARAQIVASDRQIAAAQIAYDGVREEAKLGARTTLDVLDAEQELLDAQVNRIAATNQQYVAVYSLLGSMGLLTADHLKLGILTYDPAAYYNIVKRAPTLSAQGARLDKVLRSLGKD